MTRRDLVAALCHLDRLPVPIEHPDRVALERLLIDAHSTFERVDRLRARRASSLPH